MSSSSSLSSSPSSSEPGSSTRAVHADRAVRPGRALAPPIYQTAAFAAPDADTFARAAVEPRGQDFYTRFGNPNHAQVAAVVAELEGTEAALVTASGMAALTTTVLALVSAGDHVIGQRSTYGGTASVLLNLLPRLGVSTTLVDQEDPGAFERALTPRTRLILLESPSNPLLRITDLRAVAALARAHGALTVADNTFATPLNQRPAEYGVDLVWHSATKYLNGHSDVSAGVLAGPAALLDRVWDTALLTGAVLGPLDAWLLLRGLRTLPLRVARHNANGLALAEALTDHPAVTRVHYPGLPSHPQHALAAAQMTGFGGVLGIEFAGGFEAADAFLGRLRHPRRSASLGGVESLAVHPASMWRGMLGDDQIAGSGVPAGLVRLAAGTEDTADLVADALAAADPDPPQR
ncbi:aminotransferase class I/II-fold pyridoxal phosphate-dependent enzyme [Streptomyces sp. NPDC093252]|uniref:trans-sulfuration enzyme family protein n=1 Tax=Streptomyces sp. NPDC093252 TaxID=3154980 RepID=UPI003423D37D